MNFLGGVVDLDKIEAGVSLILEGLGVDLEDHNFKDTPKRAARVYKEVFTPSKTNWPVFDEKYTDMVMLRNFTFYTFCPHHLLPVKLRSTIAYIPDGKVIGMSKLGRMQLEANRFPMTQEALTYAIIQKINELTSKTAAGAAIVMQAEHGCFQIRGLHTNADAVTFKYAGCFETDENLQQRFLQYANLR
jgi:GTP cyclohydrolase IA